MRPFSFKKDDLQMGQLTLYVATPLDNDEYRKEVYDMGPNFGDTEWEQLKGDLQLGWTLYQKIQTSAVKQLPVDDKLKCPYCRGYGLCLCEIEPNGE